jgi:hypothetical protein
MVVASKTLLTIGSLTLISKRLSVYLSKVDGDLSYNGKGYVEKKNHRNLEEKIYMVEFDLVLNLRAITLQANQQ